MENANGDAVKANSSVIKNDATPAFEVQLSSINGRNPSLYDFSGTGTSTPQDADPTQLR